MVDHHRQRRRTSNRAQVVEHLRSIHVGWAALLMIALGAVIALIATLSGWMSYGPAAFIAAAVLAGTLLGLATWDLMVGLLAIRYIPYVALPERITLCVPARAVPFLSPATFVAGLLIGHQIWH